MPVVVLAPMPVVVLAPVPAFILARVHNPLPRSTPTHDSLVPRLEARDSFPGVDVRRAQDRGRTTVRFERGTAAGKREPEPEQMWERMWEWERERMWEWKRKRMWERDRRTGRARGVRADARLRWARGRARGRGQGQGRAADTVRLVSLLQRIVQV